MPPQELLNCSTLETQKLELLTEVSNLKLKLTAVDRDPREGEVSCTCCGATRSWQPLAHCFTLTKVGLSRLERSVTDAVWTSLTFTKEA